MGAGEKIQTLSSLQVGGGGEVFTEIAIVSDDKVRCDHGTGVPKDTHLPGFPLP